MFCKIFQKNTKMSKMNDFDDAMVQLSSIVFRTKFEIQIFKNVIIGEVFFHLLLAAEHSNKKKKRISQNENKFKSTYT